MENSSFREHIDDLRALIIQIVIIIFTGFILIFYFHQPLSKIILNHWQSTSTSNLIEKEIRYKRIENSTSTTHPFTLPINSQTINVENAVLKQKKDLFIYQIEPKGFVEYLTVEEAQLLLLSPLEGLIQTLKISLWLSFVITSPFWSWFIFKFISSGLHSQEKVVILPFTFFSLIFAACGIFLAHYFTIPTANQFLIAFNSTLGKNAWSLANYVDYVWIIYFGHIIASELCLVLFLLVHFQILTSENLVNRRRYMIVTIFILAAILTPPDIFTQFALALPLIIFYEFAIIYGTYRKNDQK